MNHSTRTAVAWAVLLAASTIAFAGAAAEGGRPAAGGDYEKGLARYDRAVQSGELDHPGYREALALWEPFARSGHPGASYHVGLLHYFGAGGVSFDQPKGIGLIRSAARQGYPTAQSFLGLLAEQGDGVAVRRSDEEALDWYRKAAAQDQCAAVRRLVRAYEQGELGLERAPEQAEQWGRRVAGCRRR